jgi:hypothetical protein
MIVYKGNHVTGQRDSFAPFGICIEFQHREDVEDFLARMLVAPSVVNNYSRVANCHDTCANDENADGLYNLVKQAAIKATMGEL